jgi:hypothetical protein
MLAQILIALGAGLMGLLGTIHIIYTFFTSKLEPRDAAAIDVMKATSPVLTRRTTLWNGWIGLMPALVWACCRSPQLIFC